MTPLTPWRANPVEPGTTEASAVRTTGRASSGHLLAQRQGLRPLVTINLTVASHLLGTPHLPDLRGAILVIEDVGEAPYRIDRMLTHWRLAGVAATRWDRFRSLQRL